MKYSDNDRSRREGKKRQDGRGFQENKARRGGQEDRPRKEREYRNAVDFEANGAEAVGENSRIVEGRNAVLEAFRSGKHCS